MDRSEAPDSLTPPPTQESAMADTPMLEAPATTVEHAPTTFDPVAAATDRADPRQWQQQQQQQPEEQPQQQPQQSHPAGEPPPPPPGTSPTTPSLRDPIPRQSTPRQHEDPSSHDRAPPLSSYPTAPNSLPRTPHPSMSAPSAPRAPTTDSIPHLYSYPTAPASAPQTPQQPTPQQGTSATASLESPAASPAPRITFDASLTPKNRLPLPLQPHLRMVRQLRLQRLETPPRHPRPNPHDRLHPRQRLPLALPPRPHLRAHNVAPQLHRGPLGAHAAPHRGVAVPEDIGERGRGAAPAAGGAPAV
ncbi:hypothetical protein BDR22DRAFT_400262 [Usnea florida]